MRKYHTLIPAGEAWNGVQETIDSLEDFAMLIDEDHYIVMVNKKIREYENLPDQLVGQYCPKAIHGLDGPFPGCPLAQVVQTQRASDNTLYDDSLQAWLRLGIYPTGFATPSGRRIYLHTTSDVTEQVKNTLDVELKAKILDSATDSIFVHDLDGNFIYVNEAAHRALGYTKDELININLKNLDAPKYADLLDLRTKELSTIGQMSFESAHIRKDGSRMPVEVNAKMVESEGRQLVLSVVRDLTQRKQIDKKLKDARERLDHILMTSPAIIYACDLDEDNVPSPTFVSDNIRTILGYAPEESLSQDWWLANIHPDDAAVVTHQIDGLLQLGHLGRQYRIRHKNGNYIWIRDEQTLVRDADGLPIEFIGSWTNITQLKNAELRLKKERDTAQGYLDIASVIILALDKDGKIKQINHKGCQILGCTRDAEVLGTDWFDHFIPADDRKRVRSLFLDIVSDSLKEAEYFENPIIDLHGNIRIIAWHNALVRDENGEIIGTLSSGNDITQQKQSEQALAESEARYRTLFENAPDAILLAEVKTGIIKFANRATAELLKKPIDEIIGSSQRALHPERLSDYASKAFAKAIGEAAKTGKANPVEIPIVRSDGQEIPVEIIADILTVDGVEVAQGIFRDISERKQAEQELALSYERLRQSRDSTIKAMAGMVEQRDPYTAGHQQRVSQLACEIAKEMGLDKDRIDNIRIAGLIHDIGKISVPAEILSKPGRLEEAEMNLIRRHPLTGYELLKDIDLPDIIAGIVGQHHERLNGSGYPHGLTGSEIHLEARIMAVADVAEAMSSHRPYRAALGIEHAMQEINEQKGILYDPDVVDAFKRLLESGKSEVITLKPVAHQ